MSFFDTLPAGLLLLPGLVHAAQSAPSCGAFDAQFAGGGFDAAVVDFERFDEGSGARLIAAGEFTVAGSVRALRVARWDGSAWSAVGAGFSGAANDVEVIDLGAGGQLYATGRFQATGGSPCLRIARWNGASWTPLGPGLNNVGWALCELPTPQGNRLVVGGEFTMVGAQPALRVAMWDGVSWSPLGAGLGAANSSARVSALAVHDDGSGPALYAAGTFPGGVARWNGSQWTVVGAGLVGTPLALASYDAGAGQRSLLVGGNFGTGPTSVLKSWNGASWSEAGLDHYTGGIERILVRAEGTGRVAYLAGSFTPAAGASSQSTLIARWSPTGITPLPALRERVQALAFFDAGSGESLHAGGFFTRVPSAPTPELHRVARLENLGWLPLEPAGHTLQRDNAYPSSGGWALQAWTHPTTGERDLYIGGQFDGSSDAPALRNLARWDGARFHDVSTPLASVVSALGEWRPQAGASPLLVASDSFGTRSYDGTAWTQLGTPSVWSASALVEFTPPGAPAPRLYAFGNALNGNIPGGLFHLQFDGQSWQPLVGGVDAPVAAAVVWDAPGSLPPGIYVGGRFITVQGNFVPGLALWDGATWHVVPAGGFSQVYRLRVWDDGFGEALYAVTDAGLRRFDGTGWTALGANGSILEPYDDGSGPALYLSDRMRLRNGVQESFGAATVLAPYPYEARHWVDEHGLSQGLFFTGGFEALGGTPAVGFARYWSPCAQVRTYCTAKVNSLGCTPRVGSTGFPSASASTPFVVSVADVPSQKSGLFFFGVQGRIAQPFMGGTLCVRAPVQRSPVGTSGGTLGPVDCSGVLALDFQPYLRGQHGSGLTFGDTVQGQWWYRDPAASYSLGLSDALEFSVYP